MFRKKRIKTSHRGVTHRAFVEQRCSRHFLVLIKKGMWRFGVHRVLSFLRKSVAFVLLLHVTDFGDRRPVSEV